MIDLRLGDCFELFKDIPAQSVDFICTDMPYGVTKAPWDCKVDLSALWTEIKRVLKPAGVCAMFGSGKFAYELAFSNFDWFRYRYCWFKGDCVTGFLNAKRRPLVASEDILIFSAKQGTYNQQRRLPKAGGGGPRPYLHSAGLPKNKWPILWGGPTCRQQKLRWPALSYRRFRVRTIANSKTDQLNSKATKRTRVPCKNLLK